MIKSVIDPANALQEKLFEIPSYVTAFEQKDPTVLTQWLQWIEALEALFKSYNFTQCAEIAGYRASIITTHYSAIEKRREKRKALHYAAVKSVQPVQQILSDKYHELHEKIEHVRTLIKQILIPAKDAGMITYDNKTDFTLFIETLLVQFKAHEQLRPSINNAMALLGKYDVIRIIAEEINL